MDQKLRALTLIARGDTNSQVVAYLLENFGVSITESAISQLHKNNKDTVNEMINKMVEGEQAEADAIVKRTHRMIAKKLDRAERDQNALDELDEMYRNNEIKVEDYRRRKAGLMKMSINELMTISKGVFAQTIKHPPALPPGTPTPPGQRTAGNLPAPNHLEAMLQAIERGDTVELQRLTFNPKGA